MGLLYKNKELFFSELNLTEIVNGKDEAFYLYDLDGMLEQVEFFQNCIGAKTKIHYAIKANSNKTILSAFAKKGLGADVVSKGEIERALQSGFAAEDIIFSGVGKSEKEIIFALNNRISQINVESISELKRIGRLAKNIGVQALVALRLNPNVESETHPYITTGLRDNKFGIEVRKIDELIMVLKEFGKNLDFKGITIHIGSQITSVDPFRESIRKILPVLEKMRGEGFVTKTLDIGGGLGINYEKSCIDKELIKDYGKMISEELGSYDYKVYCEPGRVLTACDGILLTKVEYIKHNEYKSFAITNTGMHHLIRPALYQSKHKILPLLQKKSPEKLRETFDIVGPVCESSDFLAKDCKIEGLEEGDWLAIADVGAYGMTMANSYNAHPLPEEVVLFNREVLENT